MTARRFIVLCYVIAASSLAIAAVTDARWPLSLMAISAVIGGIIAVGESLGGRHG